MDRSGLQDSDLPFAELIGLKRENGCEVQDAVPGPGAVVSRDSSKD